MMNNEKIENFSNQRLEKESEFENYIQGLESNLEDEYDNEEENFDLPENPTPIEELKYQVCQKFVIYKQENNLSLEEFCKRAKVDIKTSKNILYYHLNEFGLENLINVATNVFDLKLGLLKARGRTFPVCNNVPRQYVEESSL